MSLQTMFNVIVAGLASQSFQRSMREVDAKEFGDQYKCAYHGEEGRKCAAGHYMRNDAYKPFFEDSSVQSLVHENQDIWISPIKWGTSEASLLQYCQDAHDVGKTPQDMRERLRKVGERFELEIPQTLL